MQMGCTTSKQPVCRNCQTPCSPMTRSYSMHVHHPPQREGDTYHVVALKSTTLGNLQLDPSKTIKEQSTVRDHHQQGVGENFPEKKSKEFSVGVIEAKTWSKMIEEKIPKVVPKTPIRTPPGEPETINAWELMEGLDDTSPLRPPANHHHYRSFSFHVAPNSIPVIDKPDSKLNNIGEEPIRKPLWLQMAENNDSSYSNSNDTSIASEFDPDVISAFRKSLEELPPANPFHLKPLVNEKQQQQNGDSFEVTDENNLLQSKNPPRGKEKLVLYFTSLRGVRKTYEDCCHVRVILKGIGVRVDERDVSMHSGFKDELKDLLGDGFNNGGLPRVFVGRKYIGGAAEIWRMHEDGHLEKVLESCEMAEDGGSGGEGGGVGGGVVCKACGDIRFLPCETCSGSCKIYYEGFSDEMDDDDEEEDESEFGFQRCPDCNENGLIRCPICCD